MKIKASTLQWMFLLVLTCLTFSIGEVGAQGSKVVGLVLAITVIKGRLVIDQFMGLQGVAGFWRWLVLGWLAVVASMIGLAFWLALSRSM